MTHTKNGGRPSRKGAVDTRRRSDTLARQVRRQMAVRVNRLAHPNAKKSAARLGCDRRTIERRRSPKYCEHSPEYRMLEAIDAAENPMVLIEFLEVAIYRAVARLRDKPTAKLVADYRKILADDATNEGTDHLHKVRRGIAWLDRCMGSVVDATDDRDKAAHELEFAYRGVSEQEVFG